MFTVSRPTHARVFALWIAATLLVTSASVKADPGPYAKARGEYSKASYDYFIALRRGEGATPEARAALRDKYLNPASAKVKQAYEQEAREVRAQTQKKLDLALQGAGASPSGTAGKNGAGGASASGSRSSAAGESEPGWVLDGKEIPREVEFEGPAKAAGASKAAAAPKAAPKAGAKAAIRPSR